MSFFWKGKPVNTLQLTNKDRLEIVRAGLGSELIVAMVKDRAAQLKKLQGDHEFCMPTDRHVHVSRPNN